MKRQPTAESREGTGVIGHLIWTFDLLRGSPSCKALPSGTPWMSWCCSSSSCSSCLSLPTPSPTPVLAPALTHSLTLCPPSPSLALLSRPPFVDQSYSHQLTHSYSRSYGYQDERRRSLFYMLSHHRLFANVCATPLLLSPSLQVARPAFHQRPRVSHR